MLFHGAPGEIQFIVTNPVTDPSLDWYLKNEGPGVMVLESKVFGHAYIRAAEEAEDLVFVSRAGTAPPT